MALWDLMTAPAKVGARMMDMVTGGSSVTLDNIHHVAGNDPGRWTDTFAKNPSLISPMAVGHTKSGRVHSGRPFPGGPRIGIEIKSRHDSKLPNGRKQTVLEVRYSGDFVGPGRITITQSPGKGLEVRDQWLGVENRSMLPSRAAEVGHPVVAHMGFDSMGKMSRR
jgi:hypothetical protein